MTANKVSKDKNGNYEGHAFTLAMLEAQLSGNHMKVVLAYMNIGGFNPNDSVFLTRKDYERFGMVRQTVSRLRQDLVRAGWLVKDTSRKSAADYEYYFVKVGGPVTKEDKGGNIMSHPVSQNETAPVAIQDTEITTDLTKNNNELNNIVRVGDAHTSANASVNPIKNNSIGEKQSSPAADAAALDSLILNTLNGLSFADDLISEYKAGLNDPENMRVSQIETPKKVSVNGRVLTQTGELDW